MSKATRLAHKATDTESAEISGVEVSKYVVKHVVPEDRDYFGNTYHPIFFDDDLDETDNPEDFPPVRLEGHWTELRQWFIEHNPERLRDYRGAQVAAAMRYGARHRFSEANPGDHATPERVLCWLKQQGPLGFGGSE